MSFFQPSSPPPDLDGSPLLQLLEVVDSEAATAIPAPSAFDQTTTNLLRLGSLTMDKFAQDPSEELDGFDIPLIDPANPNSSAYYSGDRTMGGLDDDEPQIPNVAPTESVRYLRDLTHRVFGITKIEILKYDIIEELGGNRMSCILTVTRPNGVSRSYRTKPEFSRKTDAKVAAATSAIKLGCVNFIKNGDESGKARRGPVLAKLDAGLKKDEGDAAGKPADEATAVPDGAVMEIENCCTEWRAGAVSPQWVYLMEQKVNNAYGCAVKISLSLHIQRTYSVLSSPEYHKRSLAKAACAKVAIQQGILDFIQHGDGLDRPVLAPMGVALGPDASPFPVSKSAMTIHAFYASLPKPMPEEIGTKGNGEINGVAWLNNTIQIAKGSRMTLSFHWYTDTKLGLHGCLLRLTRPDAPSQSYMVDAVFPKRGDAKLAVCIYACSQGFGQWIRDVAAEIDARVTPAMRRRSAEEIIPAVGQALNRIRHGLRPDFSFACDLSTFSCIMTIDLSDGGDGSLRRQWSVPMEYKTKMDAKVAVLCSAADDELLDFIKYRGKIPGENDVDMVDGDDNGKKRKRGKRSGESGSDDDDENGQRKIAKTVTTLESKEYVRARARYDDDFGKKPSGDRQFNRPFGMNGRGRGFPRGGFGGGFGPGGGRGGRGGFSQSGFNRRPFPGAPQNMPFQPQAAFHPGNFGPFRMHPQAQPQFPYLPPAHAPGSGFRGARGFPSDYMNMNHNYGGTGMGDWRGGGFAGAPMDGFMRALPSAPQPVDPARSGFHDHERDYGYPRERDYRQTHAPYAGAVLSPGSASMSGVHPHQRPMLSYDSEYPNSNSNAGVPPGSGPGPFYDPTDFSYEDEQYTGHSMAQGASRAQAYEEPDRYAPNYDRVLDRKAGNPFPTTPLPQAMQRSGSAASMIPLGTPSSSSQSGSPFSHRTPPTAPRADRLAAKQGITIAGSPHYVHPSRRPLFSNDSSPTQPAQQRPRSHSQRSRPPHNEEQYNEQPLPYEDPAPVSQPQSRTPATPADKPQPPVVSSAEHLRPPRIERRRKPAEVSTLEAGKHNAIDQKLDNVIAKLEKEAVPMDDTEGFDGPTARGRRRNLPGAGVHENNFSSKRDRSVDETSSRCMSAVRNRSRSMSRPMARSKSRDEPRSRSQSGRAKSMPPPKESTPSPSPESSPPPSKPTTKKQKVGKTKKKSVKKGKKAAVDNTAIAENGVDEHEDDDNEPNTEADANAVEVDNEVKMNGKHQTNGTNGAQTNGTERKQTNGAEKSDADETDKRETKSDKQARESITTTPRKRKDPPKSYLTALYEMCDRLARPRPALYHESKHVDEDANISDGFKVWLIMGNERLEHQLVFPTLEAGQERLAKSVLARLKGVKKKPANGES